MTLPHPSDEFERLNPPGMIAGRIGTDSLDIIHGTTRHTIRRADDGYRLGRVGEDGATCATVAECILEIAAKLLPSGIRNRQSGQQPDPEMADQLARLVDELETIEEEAGRVRRARDVLVVEMIAAGVAVSVVASLAGMSRQRLHQIMYRNHQPKEQADDL